MENPKGHSASTRRPVRVRQTRTRVPISFQPFALCFRSSIHSLIHRSICPSKPPTDFENRVGGRSTKQPKPRIASVPSSSVVSPCHGQVARLPQHLFSVSPIALVQHGIVPRDSVPRRRVVSFHAIAGKESVNTTPLRCVSRQSSIPQAAGACATAHDTKQDDAQSDDQPDPPKNHPVLVPRPVLFEETVLGVVLGVGSPAEGPVASPEQDARASGERFGPTR
mmetsp:Transcript_4012/g.8739  ORF Transcript_4012/g.8739 Transcript_4012/m.8739 type:complete len:223 (+) Transcript_4012:232-900(+)